MRAPLYVLSWRTSLEPILRLEQTYDRQLQLSLQLRHQLSESDSHANYERCRYSLVNQLYARRQCSVQPAAFPPTRKTGLCSQRTRKNVWQLSLISSALWRRWKVCLAALQSLCAPSRSPQSVYPSPRLDEKPHIPCHPQSSPVGRARHILQGPAFSNRPRHLPVRFHCPRRRRCHLRAHRPTSPSVLDLDFPPPCRAPPPPPAATPRRSGKRAAAPPSAMRCRRRRLLLLVLRETRHRRRRRSPPEQKPAKSRTGRVPCGTWTCH